MSAEVRTARTAFTATTRDLSEGGAGLSSDRPLEEGEEVVLGLFLVVDDVESDTPALVGQGARRLEQPRSDDNRHNAGVRFEVITDDQRAWLRQVLVGDRQAGRQELKGFSVGSAGREDPLGHARAVERGADDAAGVAGPFAAGIEARQPTARGASTGLRRNRTGALVRVSAAMSSASGSRNAGSRAPIWRSPARSASATNGGNTAARSAGSRPGR